MKISEDPCQGIDLRIWRGVQAAYERHGTLHRGDRHLEMLDSAVCLFYNSVGIRLAMCKTCDSDTPVTCINDEGNCPDCTKHGP